MPFLSIDTAPKDKLILLYLPEFGCSAPTWWSGQWSWTLKNGSSVLRS